MRTTRSIFVGRQSELEALRQRLDDLYLGQGCLVLLSGEAGIGKTSTAREFAENARQRGVIVLWGRCFEGEWQPPYSPWAEALGEMARTRDTALLHQELGPAAPILAQLVPEVRAALPDLPSAPSLSPDEGRFRVYDAVVGILSRAAEHSPLALILDDLHWADNDSLQLLRYAARALGHARILALGTYRDPEVGVTAEHPLMQTLALVRREAGYLHLQLKGFAYAELNEYLTQAAGQALPQALVQAVYAETDGNPFYTCEIWRHLTEEAKLLHRAGRWSTDSSIDELGIPEGVRQVVGRRLTRLSEEANAVLRVAASVGRQFDLAVIQDVLGLPEATLLDSLDEALESGLLRITRRLPPLYDFCHAIVQHTVYETLNPDRRVRLHRSIAQALERKYAGDELAHAAELAGHYYASRGLPEAEVGTRYALAAAQRAQANYAHAQAASFLRQARDLVSTDQATADRRKLRADILCRLVLAEANALMLREARRSAEEAMAALDAADGDRMSQAEFFAAAAQALKDGGAPSWAWEPLVSRGLALLGPARDLLWARLMLLRNRYEHLVSGPLHVGHWLGLDPEAVAIARASGDEEAYARTLEPLEWRTAEETEAVSAISRSWQEPRAIMRALDVVGRDRIYRHGAPAAGIAAYTELLVAAERYGSIPAQAEALGQITVAHIALGDPLTAQKMMGRWLELTVSLGAQHRLHVLPPLLGCLMGYYLEGDWPALAAELTSYATHAESAQMAVATVPAAYAVHSYVRAGQIDEARRLLSALLPLLDRLEVTMYLMNVSAHLASLAAWEMGAPEYAASLRRLLMAVTSVGLGSTFWGPHELMVARMDALLGRIEAALQGFEQARAWAADREHRYLAPIIDYDEAVAMLRAGVADHTTSALLDRALAAFRSLEMQGWVERALVRQEELGALGTSAPEPGASYPDGLTQRQAEVLCLLAEGMTNKEIAERLFLSVSTVARHIANTYAKIDAHGRADATAYALRQGLVPLRAADAAPPGT